MKKRSLLSIDVLSDESLKVITDGAFKVKADRAKYARALADKNLGLFFEKPSTRTRISFEVGMNQLGGNSFYLSPKGMQPGKREEIRDIARTVSRYLDALVLRTFSHETIVEMDKYASIPVINGLSDYTHPCQALADYLTIRENFGDRDDIKVTYLGDGNNVVSSLLMLFSRTGINFTVATPAGNKPDSDVLAKSIEYAKKSGASIEVTEDPEAAVKDADVLYTDVWVSMGEEESGKDSAVFEPFQINQELVSKAKKDAIVMHCLPAHRGEEITDDVMEGAQSVVFDQAENRLHAQKAAMMFLLGADF